MDIRHLFIPAVSTNCYVLIDEDSKAAAVVDPGENVTEELKQLAQEEGVDLRAIYLTHGHFDHVGGVSALRAAFPQTQVFLHPADADQNDPLMPTAGLGNITLWRDGDVVKLGGLNVEVLHTPGHTKGSVTLRCRDVLFTGDTLFAGSCGRTDFPGGSYPEIMASLKRLAGLEGDFKVLPGHEGFTTLERERQGNFYMREAMGPKA